MTQHESAECIAQHRASFSGYARRRLRDYHAAEDAVARVAETTLRNAGRIPDASNALKYFSRALHWLTLDLREQGKKRRLSTEAYGQEWTLHAKDGHRQGEQRAALREALQVALGSLPKTTQIALWRRYGHEESLGEVAQSMGIRYKALAARLREALIVLRNHSALQPWKPK